MAKLAGIKEGRAVLRVVARDRSLFPATRRCAEEFTIDITPPTLQLIAEDRYIDFGGAGAIVYKPSADTATSGRSGPFLPGPQGPGEGEEDHNRALCPPLQRAAERQGIPRRDGQAGDTREMGIPYQLKNVKYHKRAPSPSPTTSSRARWAPLLSRRDAKEGSAEETFLASTTA